VPNRYGNPRAPPRVKKNFKPLNNFYTYIWNNKGIREENSLVETLNCFINKPCEYEIIQMCFMLQQLRY